MSIKPNFEIKKIGYELGEPEIASCFSEKSKVKVYLEFMDPWEGEPIITSLKLELLKDGTVVQTKTLSKDKLIEFSQNSSKLKPDDRNSGNIGVIEYFEVSESGNYSVKATSILNDIECEKACGIEWRMHQD